MAINSKVEAIRGMLLTEGLISNQTRLKKCKEILMSSHNGMVSYGKDTCVFVTVQGNEEVVRFYYNNKLVKNTGSTLNDMDVFKVIIDPEYFKNVLNSTYPNDFSEIEFVEILLPA